MLRDHDNELRFTQLCIKGQQSREARLGCLGGARPRGRGLGICAQPCRTCTVASGRLPKRGFSSDGRQGGRTESAGKVEGGLSILAKEATLSGCWDKPLFIVITKCYTGVEPFLQTLSSVLPKGIPDTLKQNLDNRVSFIHKDRDNKYVTKPSESPELLRAGLISSPTPHPSLNRHPACTVSMLREIFEEPSLWMPFS